MPRSLAATLRDAVHPKARVRLSALADLVRWAQTDAREPCAARLLAVLEGDAEVEVRAAAALACADAGLRESLPLLLKATASGPPRLSQMALVAIGELGSASDVEVLDAVRAALASDAPALRFQALVAAGRLLPLDELAAHIEAAFAEGEAKLRYIACRILEERFFAEPEGAPPVAESLRAALAQTLEQRLSDPDADVRIAAAVLLAPRGSTAARELLVKALNARRSFAQLEDEQAAIELCAELGLNAARPGLTTRAFGGWLGSSPLAFQARVALARLGDERAAQHILRGLTSRSRGVRAQCVAAAGLARLEAARPRLLEMRHDERAVDARSVTEALLALDR